jgi:hypothetical protein
MPAEEPNVIIADSAVAPPAAGRGRSLKQGNLLLAALFAAGIVGVYLLSLRNGPAVASAQEQDNEAAVATALSELKVEAARQAKPSDKALALVDTFYYETRQRQVPLEHLAGNPFEYKPRASENPSPLSAAATDAGEAPVENLRSTEAMAAVRQLKLQSVLTGPHGATAMISNNLLTEGQAIQGWTVAKIDPREVTLTWKDQSAKLKLQ